MVKLSKGCLPCRLKRTKCDLLLPSCTQCIRKSRVCSGYRNETDLLFKNETPAVVQRTKRKNTQGGDNTAFQLMTVPPQQPSRRAVINDEAIVHYLGLYNDKVIAASGPLEGGFDYLTSVIQADLRTGGPVAEMAMACGLASLGNSTGSVELVRTARVKHLKVLQQLSKQLQDKDLALSDSSITTCILLAAFETLVADDPVPNGPYMTHLLGAVKLLELRGDSQMHTDLGYSIWLKLRNMILVDCLRLGRQLPGAINRYLESDARRAQQEFYPDFFMIMDSLCALRDDQKANGYVRAETFERTQRLHEEFEDRCERLCQHVSDARPAAESVDHENNAETTYRFFSLASAWMFVQCTRVIFADIFLDWSRAEHGKDPTLITLAAMQHDAQQHQHCCQIVQDGVSYYLAHFAANKTATRIHGGIYMLWPLGLFLSLSTVSVNRLKWVVEQGKMISDAFSLRMGNIMAEAAEEQLKSFGEIKHD
ncbi:unnamed protein product [Periconia digitata]|uniref:Zn(2)-C6 fungal-type domain-containing protein n=1 Tax=Periconia digitata TaxID=1303443 RepID=A0A9W4U551_9PLEO|nr:unnamed protein product [Periconia digitata]